MTTTTAGSWAEISKDDLYRYALGRVWDGRRPVLGWLMLNPSTADSVVSDQTIGRVVYFSEREGYGGAWVANLYGLRSPSPDVLRALARVRPGMAAGPDNDSWLTRMLAAVPAVVLAWGAHGGEPWAVSRRDKVLAMIAESGVPALCLGRTAGGQPRHPCRLGNSTPLEAWPG